LRVRSAGVRVMPGYIDRIVKPARCRYCGGADLGDFGVIHHKPSCTRNTCSICSRHIEIGEHRAAGVPARHLDCEIDLIEHLDEEHADGV
jgi:hypothetical protein